MYTTMKEQFNRIAHEYDSGRKKFIPCFNEFYESTTDFIASGIPAPKQVLDLGAGTGLLSVFYYHHFPDAKYLLIDIAGEMLDIARMRFSDCPNVLFQEMNYAQSLPSEEFDLIISALSIHHLENEHKAELFQRIHDKLPPGGFFINYDQFCFDTPEVNEWVDSYWIAQLHKSDLTEAELSRWRERRKLDCECSLSAETAMLKESGFSKVNCFFQSQKFSVVAARK